MSTTDDTERESKIIDLLSNLDVDFGYAVGNLNMDTKLESRAEIIKKLSDFLVADRKQTAKAIVERIRLKRIKVPDYGKIKPEKQDATYWKNQGYNKAVDVLRAVLKDVEEGL